MLEVQYSRHFRLGVILKLEDLNGSFTSGEKSGQDGVTTPRRSPICCKIAVRVPFQVFGATRHARENSLS